MDLIWIKKKGETMASKTRKVSFYRLALEKQTLIPGTNSVRVKQLSNSDIETYFQRICAEKMQTLVNGHKAMNITVSSSHYVIEVISIEDHRAFIKIGQQNPSNTVALRDRTTLETESVPMKESQLLELYTFCLIDFETGIVSYIGINGAPRISAVRNLFDQNLERDENVSAHLAAIMTNDILKVLVNKHIISKLSVTVAVPEDQILSDIGLDRESFDSVRNVKTRMATYKIVGQRNKNIFSSSGKFAEMIASIKMKYGDNLKGLCANAKDFNEKSQSYDLLQYNFTKTVILGRDDSGLLTLDDFKDALVQTYILYKNELLQYSRV
ncbi:MAG: hypothetical protein IJZ74_00535 [Clostridia bacterium]|nr:hypothetical protein [Clostridia bacterium]